MPSLSQLFAGIIYKAFMSTISFLFSLVIAAFEGMFYMHNAITYRIYEFYAPQDINATALAVKCIPDNDSAHGSRERNSDIIVKIEEGPQNNDESLTPVTDYSNQNQPKNAHKDAYVVINITDENGCQRIKQDPNVTRVAIAAVFLRCCNKCAVSM